MRTRPLSDFLLVLFGPAVWFVHFFAVYAAEALVCVRPGEAHVFRLIVIALTVIAVGALGGVMLRVRRGFSGPGPDTGRFLRSAAIILATLSFIALVWVALPGMTVAACTNPT